MSAPVRVPDSVIVLLNHLEALMDAGKLEEDAIPTDMWNAVSMHNFALAHQPAPVADDAMRELVEAAEILIAGFDGDGSGDEDYEVLRAALARVQGM